MIQQDDIIQPVLTGDEVRKAAAFARSMTAPSDTTQPGDYVMAGALAALSKLRAPVAGEAQPVAWLHQCRKKPELAQLTMKKHEPALAAKGYRPMPLYAAPQASAEGAAAPSADAALLVGFIFDRFGKPGDAGELPDNVAAAVRRLELALKQPQAGKDAAPRTCPSGDGSLRHPCPMHPGADKDGGQQRAGDAVAAEALAHLRTIANFGGTLDQAKELAARGVWRCAALSAAQAEQGERDAG